MTIRHTLRPYQVEVGRAVLDSVLNRRGLTFTVEMARQGGKNELSAQLEVLLLTMGMVRGVSLVKAAGSCTARSASTSEARPRLLIRGTGKCRGP